MPETLHTPIGDGAEPKVQKAQARVAPLKYICYNFTMETLKANRPLHNPDFPEDIFDMGPEDRRNVIDHYKSWADTAIRTDLQSRCLPLEVVAENFAYDFNISTVVRNANAFNARGVHILGRKRWDKRGAVGSYHYTPVRHHTDPDLFFTSLKRNGFTIVVIDNVPGSVRIDEHTWGPKQPLAVVFGQEAIGVSNKALDYADHVIRIEQYGSVRSLNVGVTSGIVLHQIASTWS